MSVVFGYLPGQVAGNQHITSSIVRNGAEGVITTENGDQIIEGNLTLKGKLLMTTGQEIDVSTISTYTMADPYMKLNTQATTNNVGTSGLIITRQGAGVFPYQMLVSMSTGEMYGGVVTGDIETTVDNLNRFVLLDEITAPSYTEYPMLIWDAARQRSRKSASFKYLFPGDASYTGWSITAAMRNVLSAGERNTVAYLTDTPADGANLLKVGVEGASTVYTGIGTTTVDSTEAGYITAHSSTEATLRPLKIDGTTIDIKTAFQIGEDATTSILLAYKPTLSLIVDKLAITQKVGATSPYTVEVTGSTHITTDVVVDGTVQGNVTSNDISAMNMSYLLPATVTTAAVLFGGTETVITSTEGNTYAVKGQYMQDQLAYELVVKFTIAAPSATETILRLPILLGPGNVEVTNLISRVRSVIGITQQWNAAYDTLAKAWPIPASDVEIVPPETIQAGGDLTATALAAKSMAVLRLRLATVAGYYRCVFSVVYNRTADGDVV